MFRQFILNNHSNVNQQDKVASTHKQYDYGDQCQALKGQTQEQEDYEHFQYLFSLYKDRLGPGQNKSSSAATVTR